MSIKGIERYAKSQKAQILSGPFEITFVYQLTV